MKYTHAIKLACIAALMALTASALPGDSYAVNQAGGGFSVNAIDATLGGGLIGDDTGAIGIGFVVPPWPYCGKKSTGCTPQPDKDNGYACGHQAGASCTTHGHTAGGADCQCCESIEEEVVPATDPKTYKKVNCNRLVTP